jgi:hypothetical protein
MKYFIILTIEKKLVKSLTHTRYMYVRVSCGCVCEYMM